MWQLRSSFICVIAIVPRRRCALQAALSFKGFQTLLKIFSLFFNFQIPGDLICPGNCECSFLANNDVPLNGGNVLCEADRVEDGVEMCIWKPINMYLLDWSDDVLNLFSPFLKITQMGKRIEMLEIS